MINEIFVHYSTVSERKYVSCMDDVFYLKVSQVCMYSSNKLLFVVCLITSMCKVQGMIADHNHNIMNILTCLCVITPHSLQTVVLLHFRLLCHSV